MLHRGVDRHHHQAPQLGVMATASFFHVLAGQPRWPPMTCVTRNLCPITKGLFDNNWSEHCHGLRLSGREDFPLSQQVKSASI